MIELKDVYVTYPNGVNALNGINLTINDGDFAFVVGSSGAGKSTLIKTILKEVDVTSGKVMVNNFEVSNIRRKDIPHLRRTISVVFQDFRLIPSMTVYDNVAFVLRATDTSSKFIRSRVPYVLGLVNLSHKLEAYPSELSGGEQQRVALARALAPDPKLIVADEPTGNIDPELSYEIVDLLKGINECGTTILMVTHEHDLVKFFGGRIISIESGNVVFDETVEGTE
ncbi:MAG: ATP-binding cassette domain-containing protein [Ruminococcus sp.]|jgi:cell division transport system ATP-binding protein|nr:ATP-binding cassette domain-containing protein [Ruminococcus sp.]